MFIYFVIIFGLFSYHMRTDAIISVSPISDLVNFYIFVFFSDTVTLCDVSNNFYSTWKGKVVEILSTAGDYDSSGNKSHV